MILFLHTISIQLRTRTPIYTALPVQFHGKPSTKIFDVFGLEIGVNITLDMIEVICNSRSLADRFSGISICSTCIIKNLVFPCWLI